MNNNVFVRKCIFLNIRVFLFISIISSVMYSMDPSEILLAACKKKDSDYPSNKNIYSTLSFAPSIAELDKKILFYCVEESGYQYILENVNKHRFSEKKLVVCDKGIIYKKIYHPYVIQVHLDISQLRLYSNNLSEFFIYLLNKVQDKSPYFSGKITNYTFCEKNMKSITFTSSFSIKKDLLDFLKSLSES